MSGFVGYETIHVRSAAEEEQTDSEEEQLVLERVLRREVAALRRRADATPPVGFKAFAGRGHHIMEEPAKFSVPVPKAMPKNASAAADLQADLAALRRRYEALQTIGAPPPPKATQEAGARMGATSVPVKAPPETRSTPTGPPANPALAAAPWRNPWYDQPKALPMPPKAVQASPAQPASPPPPELLAKGVGKGKGNRNGDQQVMMLREKAAASALSRMSGAAADPVMMPREKAAAAALSRMSGDAAVPPPKATPEAGVRMGATSPPEAGARMGATSPPPTKVVAVNLSDSDDPWADIDSAPKKEYTPASSSTGASGPAPRTFSEFMSEKRKHNESDDDVDMCTNATSVRSAKSKLSCQNSTGVKIKKLEAIKAYRLANGLPWEEREHHYVDKKAADVIKDGAKVLDPDEANRLAGVVKGLSDKQQFSKEELMELMMEYEEFFRPRWVKEPTEAAIISVERRFIKPRSDPQWPGWNGSWCLLCLKWSDDKHRSCAEHQTKCKEMAAGDVLIGESESSRRFENTLAGMERHLTRNNMTMFWGSSLDVMPRLLWDRLRQDAKCEVQIPGWGKHRKYLKYSDVQDATLVSVTYKGQGKYETDQDVAVRWEDTTDRLIDPADAPKHLEGSKERGWWPAVWVQWKGEHQDLQYHGSDAEYRLRQLQGMCVIWVACWYQLWEGVWVIVLWPVYLRARL